MSIKRRLRLAWRALCGVPLIDPGDYFSYPGKMTFTAGKGDSFGPVTFASGKLEQTLFAGWIASGGGSNTYEITTLPDKK